jgi:ketosteroid isomerase-like protein
MSADHLTIVDNFYAAFGANNPEMLGETVTEDFRIHIPVMDYLPLKGLYVGKAGFKQLLDERVGEVEYQTFDVFDTVSQEDVVVRFGRTTGMAVKKDRPFEHDWVHVFRFEGGRLAVFKEYIDSSSVCVAFAP